MSISSFIPIFFRLFNFIIVIGLGYYLFKKYFKSRIDEKISQKAALLKGLEEQGYFLEGKAHDLDIRLEQQERNAIQLQQKINEWSLYIAGENNKRHEEYRVNVARIAQRIEVQNIIVAQHQWRMRILPEVLENVQDLLVKEFSEQSRAQEYLHTIAQRLGRK